jgi:transcriptional regulator with XRE-family HTH domain
MKITNLLTDEAVLAELGTRMAEIRLSQNRTQAELAAQAGVARSTIERLEHSKAQINLGAFIRICRALDLLDRFDTLVPELGPSPMDLAQLQGQRRQRAAGPREKKHKAASWSWAK